VRRGSADYQLPGEPAGPHDRIMQRPAEILTSGQVTLRRWRPADAPVLLELVTESIEHLRRWLPWAVRYDAGDSAGYLRQCEQDWASGAAFNYAITTGGDPLGSCSLMARIGPGGMEIGYWVHQGNTRRGLATDAAAALTATALAMPGIDRVEIVHDEANIASAGVPRKLGFTEVDKRMSGSEERAPAESGIRIVWRLTR
jgi:ribosomal-protein-serine acetyltransferase